MDARQREIFRNAMHKPEMLFFFRVWMPCLLFYYDYPVNILRKARSGEDKAIEKILRLDKSTIGDKEILEIFHEASVAKAQGRMDMITKALRKAPKMMTKAKLRNKIAVLVSNMSEGIEFIKSD